MGRRTVWGRLNQTRRRTGYTVSRLALARTSLEPGNKPIIQPAKTRAYEEALYTLFTRANVLVENLGPLDRDEVEPALFRDRRRQQRLAATREAVQKQAVQPVS
jgi:hypothetical protein